MLGRQELVNKLVAKNTGISEEEVSRIMDFSYRKLAKELHECSHTFLYVRGLGTFALKQRSVKNRLYRLHYMVCKRKKHKQSPSTEKAIKTMKDEMFKLFEIRRLIRKTYRIKDSLNRKR